jgi:triacylglycerol lipase
MSRGAIAMSSLTRTMPPSTFTALIPPKEGYSYFEDAEDFPFQGQVVGYSPVNAWWLAEASFLAYEQASEVLKRADLSDRLKLSLQVFDGTIHDNQCIVAAGDGFAIVAFRGTQVEGFPDPIDLFRLRIVNPTDLGIDVNFPIPPGTHVHPGFAASLDEVWGDIKAHLDSIGGNDGRRAIWFTGHSLGAALATLAADRYGSENVRGLYTFGSPRVGDGVFANHFSAPCFRFVNDLDFVPHLPPHDVYEDYEHVNATLMFIDSGGEIRSDETLLRQIESGAAGSFQAIEGVAGAFAPSAILGHLFGARVPDTTDVAGGLGLDVIPFAPLADHAPIYYSTRLWNALVEDQA